MNPPLMPAASPHQQSIGFLHNRPLSRFIIALSSGFQQCHVLNSRPSPVRPFSSTLPHVAILQIISFPVLFLFRRLPPPEMEMGHIS